MIGRLRGILVEKQPPHLLLEVGGLCYEVEAPMTTFYALPEIGTETTLYTHLLVRDDAQLLYGFARQDQRRLFRSLIRVNGVGARVALTILSGMDSDEFIERVCSGDAARLSSLPGIGKKTAERLIVEMRDRLASWNEESGEPPGHPQSNTLGNTLGNALGDAVHALITLGYHQRQAQRFAREVAKPGMSSEAIIRAALKLLLRA